MTLRSEPFGSRGRVAETLRRADVYVHATKADNHPLAVLEALACGVPVVAPRVGGIPEQLTEETGVLVEPGDATGARARDRRPARATTVAGARWARRPPRTRARASGSSGRSTRISTSTRA